MSIGKWNWSNTFFLRRIPAVTLWLQSPTLRWGSFLICIIDLMTTLSFPGEHPAWEGGGDHRLPGRRGQPLHHGAAQALPPRELVRLPQVRPLPLGLHLHWLLVQHDDPGHPVLGGPLHLAPPVQEQPGVSGRDCGLREHPDERDQGQGHVGHSHEQGFSKERRIGFLSQCPMFISKLTAPKASSMFRREPVNTWIILSVHSCSSTWGKLSYCQSKKLADFESRFRHANVNSARPIPGFILQEHNCTLFICPFYLDQHLSWCCQSTFQIYILSFIFKLEAKRNQNLT